MAFETHSKRGTKPVERFEGELRVNGSRSIPRNSESTAKLTRTAALKLQAQKSVKKTETNL